MQYIKYYYFSLEFVTLLFKSMNVDNNYIDIKTYMYIYVMLQCCMFIEMTNLNWNNLHASNPIVMSIKYAKKEKKQGHKGLI